VSNLSLSLGNKRTAGSGAARRWGRRLLVAAVALVVGLPLVYAIFQGVTSIDPPAIPREVALQAQQPVDQKGPRSYLGKSWMSRERGVWEEHLEGAPYTMGYAQARLGSRLLLEQEDYMFSEMHKYVPSKVALFLIRMGVRLRYRHLTDFIPLARQEEIAGLAAGSIDRHSDFLPTYHRIVFYHALHDITQGLEHSPMLGCTAFAAAGPATTNGHLIIGRNFDFEGPEIFDREKSVIFFKPTGKIPFASVAWVGMSGVVTGLNTQGIFVSINAARTDDKGREGMPVEILVREILENAHSLDEAIALIKKTPVMVPDFYLVGDGKSGESAVVERSPTRVEVRRSSPSHGETTLLANHALLPAFAGDAENDRLKRYMTSGARFKRLEELVKKAHGQIDPRRALDILRDKRGVGDVELGLGNRNALDAIIATHSVVVDATNLTLWVGEGPHLLGKFRAFDLKKELLGEDRPPTADLPEDPIALTDEYRNYQTAMASLKAAERFVKEKALDRAVEEARKAEALEEKMPEPHRLLGDAFRARGYADEAKKEYRRFLELSPPYLKDIEEVKGILGTL
jgi:isopenicillin-N N-acyltransferase-like protein